MGGLRGTGEPGGGENTEKLMAAKKPRYQGMMVSGFPKALDLEIRRKLPDPSDRRRVVVALCSVAALADDECVLKLIGAGRAVEMAIDQLGESPDSESVEQVCRERGIGPVKEILRDVLNSADTGR